MTLFSKFLISRSAFQLGLKGEIPIKRPKISGLKCCKTHYVWFVTITFHVIGNFWRIEMSYQMGRVVQNNACYQMTQWAGKCLKSAKSDTFEYLNFLQFYWMFSLHTTGWFFYFGLFDMLLIWSFFLQNMIGT